MLALQALVRLFEIEYCTRRIVNKFVDTLSVILCLYLERNSFIDYDTNSSKFLLKRITTDWNDSRRIRDQTSVLFVVLTF